uniref:Uncharacterized protein n=1 Tax=Aplanochytrium stocchinoi TaxID=215587 RepID=A0A7S3PKU8_9STRA
MRECLLSVFTKLQGKIGHLFRFYRCFLSNDIELAIPFMSSKGNEVGEIEVQIPAWLQHSLFQSLLVSFPLRTINYGISNNVPKASKLLLDVITYVYECSEQEASRISVRVVADNPDETQPEVPVFNTLMVLLGFDCILVRCKPVQGTDVSTGVVRASPFYTRIISQVSTGDKEIGLRYRDMLLSILEWFIRLDHENQSKSLLVNICVQLVEAAFNCTGRHKEVFEYLIQDFIEALINTEETQFESQCGNEINPCKSPDVTEVMKCECAHSTDLIMQNSSYSLHISMLPMLRSVPADQYLPRLLFERFLDQHKRNVLWLTMFEPLKHIFENEYTIYENLENHGVSFWGSLLERNIDKIALPFDDVQDCDNGWSWAAYDFWPVLSREEKVYFTSANNIGNSSRQFRTDMMRMKREGSRRRPNKFVANPFYYSSLRSFMERANLPKSVINGYTNRFLNLCTVDLVVERFGVFAVKQPEWNRICKIWNTSSVEIYNLETFQVNSDVLIDHLRKCGVSM